MARIVHMATTHRVSDPRIFQKECKTLAAAGHEVVYIVPHTHDEVIDGVEIKAVPAPESGKDRLVRTTRQVYQRALEEDATAIFHVHDYDLVPYGFALKMRGRRVVYDSHEDTPKQMQYQHWISPRLRPIVGRATGLMEWLAGHYFDAIIAAEPENARRFPAAKTTLLRNYPLTAELIADTAIPYDERDLIVSYVGGVTVARGLWEMAEAMRMLPDPDSELVVAGPFFPADLRGEFEQRTSGINVSAAGYLNRRGVADLLGRSRIGIVTLHPVPKYVESYPTKLFEYMSAGLPVVASDFPVWRQIIEDAGCGILVDPMQPDAIAEAVHHLFENPAEAEAMGKRGRRAVELRYNWEREADTLLGLYGRLTKAER